MRYVGFSDSSAWKVAQAQVMAHFRGWNPLIALQIEYSLMERTVEGELIPMAEELGLGVLPWGPLKSDALTDRDRARGISPTATSRGHQACDLIAIKLRRAEMDFVL